MGTILRTGDIEGMLFDIGYADGVLPFLAVSEQPVPNCTHAG
ncbi:MAG: hypothetical protein VYA69_02810 [Gemmatimonadota bacterium]|nr:hypothetical protein [Gemmatimonadota bacterium]